MTTFNNYYTVGSRIAINMLNYKILDQCWIKAETWFSPLCVQVWYPKKNTNLNIDLLYNRIISKANRNTLILTLWIIGLKLDLHYWWLRTIGTWGTHL